MSLFGLFERRASIESPLVPLTSAAVLDYVGAGMASDAGVPVTETGSLAMSAVYRAVSLISGLGGALPLHTYKAGTREQATSLLLNNPHPDLTPYEFWKLSYVHRCLWGNFYAQKVRNGAGQVTWLYPIHPSLVRVGKVARSDANPSGKIFAVRQDDGSDVPMTSREVFHIPGLGYDGVMGLSPIRMAAQAIGMALAAESYGARLFGSGNLLSGILKTTQRLEQTQAEALQTRWQTMKSGLQNAHRVAVLDSGAEFQSLTMPNDDAQLLESRRWQVTEISRFFGVPPFLLNETEKSTCIVGDVRVFTKEGPKLARDVEPGDMVWALDESAKTFVPSRVWRSEKTGHDPILNIRTRARTLRCNAQHRVLVRRKFPAPRPGYGGARAVEWRNVWVEAGDITTKDYLVALNGLPDGTSREAPNGRELTEGFMAFAGLMLGDGTVTKGAVSVARHVDAPYMPRYRDVIRAEFTRSTLGGNLPIGLRDTIDAEIRRLLHDEALSVRETAERLGVTEITVRDRYWGRLKSAGPQPVNVREYDRYSIFSSKSAADELRALGLSGTARTKRVPAWVYSLAPDLIAAFLGGYVDSDGAVNTRGWITFSSCSEALLEDVKHLCMAIGVPVGTVRRYKSGGQCVVGGRTVTRGDMYQLFAFDTTANRKITPYHPEKARRIHEAPASDVVGRWSPDYKGRGPVGSRPGETFRIEGGALQLVKEITVEPAEDVYDIGVEGNHSFIADGLVVHNSWGTGLEAQASGFVKFDLHPTWLAPTEARVTRELLPNDRYAKYKVEGLLRGDSQARAQFYNTLRNIGVLSVNEIRDLEDMSPVEAGDSRLQPLNMAPLGSETNPTEGTGDDAPQPPDEE